MVRTKVKEKKPVSKNIVSRAFHVEFLNATQKLAYAVYQQHDVSFMLGIAGSGKTHISMAFAIQDILSRQKKKIILTRPIVEAGEKLGYLPGSFEEKTGPYMVPFFDCLERMVPEGSPYREKIMNSIEIAPIAFLRGRTFHNAVCIFDEAQNATKTQLKLFLTRLGDNSKIIICGDPRQSDLSGHPDLIDVVNRLESLSGIGVVRFNEDSIVRNPLIASILERLEK